jgi:hypothetical protein
MLKHIAVGFIVAFSSFALPARAADTWNCDYEDYPDKNDIRSSDYQIVGYQLMETTVHVIDEYMLLENSDTTIVAAKAARLGPDDSVAGFQVMIDKATGTFLKTITSIGGPNRKQTGKCKLVHSKN